MLNKLKVAIIENNTTLSVPHQKPNSETSGKDINNNQCEIYYPKVTSSKITSQLHLAKNRIESSDVTFEEVLSMYVKSDFKDCLT